MPTKTINGAAIGYEEAGRGRPLVLLHGFPLDSRVWEAQRKGLADVCRVITPDLRGFGKSASSDPFTMESLAADVYALLSEIGALPCALGGLSMGGYVSLEFVRKYPAAVSGLALIDTRGEADTPEGKEGRKKMIELVREKGSKAVADQMMPKMLAPGTETSRPAVAAALRQIMESCPPKTIENALAAVRDRADHSKILASIAVPTLILVGESDAITPPAMSEAMHRGISKSELIVIKGAGHMTSMEQPELVNAALRKFVSSLSP